MVVVFVEDCKKRGLVCLCVRLIKLLMLVECCCSGA